MQNTTKSIYLQQGNLQFRGKIKIGQITLTNQQFKQLLLDNVSWKRYINYPYGQVCSKKTANHTQFYYSLQNNNLNHDPLDQNDRMWWKPIVIENSSDNKDLIFKIPNIQYDDTLKLQIQFSQNKNFSESLIVDSSNNYLTSDSSNNSDSSDNSISNNFNLFYISHPIDNDIKNFNDLLITHIYSNQILIFKKQQIIPDSYKYFRYRWYSLLHGYTKYFFGYENSLIQAFDSDSNYLNQTHVDNINIVGNGTQLNPVSLKNEILINKIIGKNNFNITTQNSNITITSDGGNGQININGSNIKFNNNNINTANGIVVLNQYGKIDDSLYIDGDFNNRLLPLKNSITQQQYGNPLVIYKTNEVQYNIQNTSSTILLIQGASKNNLAVGLKENYNSNSSDSSYSYNLINTICRDFIFQQKEQNFKGGYVLGIEYNNLNSDLQIAIQIKNQKLSDVYYKSIYQHLTSDNLLCYLAVNQDGFVFGTQNNISNPILFSNIGNNEYYKFVIQYKYSIQNKKYYSQIYCNENLCLTYYFENNPFLYEQNYVYIYFCQQVTNKSTDIYLNGINTWWRLLKVDLEIKNEEINKKIGQLYYSQANIDYRNIKVDYNWDNSTDIEDAYVFGKKNGKNYIFPYPKVEYVLPVASRTKRGGVIVGNGLYVDEFGVISINPKTDTLDLGSYIQISDQINNSNGNINIVSAINIHSSVTIKSGDIVNNHIGGKLFLGNNEYKYSGIYWTNEDICCVVNNNYSKLKYNDSQIELTNNNINIKSLNLSFNGNNLNTANGLVQLNNLGKINIDLLPFEISNGNVVLQNKLIVYDTNNNNVEYNGIKAGSGVSIVNENGIAVINADINVIADDINTIVEQNLQQQNQNINVVVKYDNSITRSDILFGYGDLIYDQQNNRYTYIVQNVNLGGFVVQDNYGYLIYPLQKQIKYNGNNSVQIDFTQFVGQHGLKATTVNQPLIQYKIRFVRGYKGNNGQLTQQQALNMILTYLW